MITVGKITSRTSSNNVITYGVTLSIFKTPGSNTEPCFTAVCSTNPGTYEPYSVGDTVYVGFVNNMLKEPVILGKVQKEIPSKSGEKSATYQYLNSLEVTGKSVLSKNTKIGDITYDNLRGCISSVGSLGDLVKSYDYAKFTESSETLTANDKDAVIGIWINDKTIYRKTFKVDMSSVSSTWTYTIDISSLPYEDIWVDHTHTFVSSSTSSMSCSCSINKTSNTVYASGNAIPGTSKYLYITIEYTKISSNL